MNLNNQSSIQITGQNKCYQNIKSYYKLCSQLLQIDQFILPFLPVALQPYIETFKKLINIQVIQRQKREQLSLHLASAYFSCSVQQRQNILKNQFQKFISKLRQIPVKIKLLITLHNLSYEVQKSYQQIQQFIRVSLQYPLNHFVVPQTLNPNQFIKLCQQNIQILKKMEIKYSINGEDTLSKKVLPNNKQQLIQLYKKRQFLPQDKFITLLTWKYQSCITCSLLFLQKQSKRITLNFMKFTKTVINSHLTTHNLIAKIYLFCINNISKKQSSIKNEEEYVYFQLQLKKMINKYKNQLSEKIIYQIETLLQKIKNKTEKEVFKNMGKYKGSQMLNKQKQINEYFKNQDQFKNLNFLVQNQSTIYQKGSKIYSSHDNIGINNFSTIRPFNINGRHSFGSQSLNKIKQYQLSLRKQRDQQQQSKISKIKYSTTARLNTQKRISKIVPSNSVSKLHSQTEHQTQDYPFLDKSEKLKPKPKHTHQVSLMVQHPRYVSNHFFNVQNKTPSKIYLSIKDKASKQLSITSMGLQNEMFMVSELIYQKPKITFKQILNDAKTIQQRQNDSQSNMINQTVSQVYIQKIEIQLEFGFIINEEIRTFKIRKLLQYSEQFICSVQDMRNHTYAKIKLQDSELFSLKSIRSLIESTDLFFQLMQIGIKGFRPQPILALALNVKNISKLQKTDPLGYYSHVNCLSNIVQISNYIKPYIYWYFTKRNKVNGSLLQKRQQMQISDPLKFSINLQFFKKNDYKGCIQLFQAVRNKKGLKQCIVYLSQGRQILCKYLVKLKGKFYVQVIQFHHKYMKHFQISKSNKLIFPLLKIYVKRYQVEQQVIQSRTLLIQKASQSITPSSRRKPLKKRTNKSNIKQEQSPEILKINMKQIFTEDQCNRILINNLNKNYIEKRFIQRMITYVKAKVKQKTIQDQLQGPSNNIKNTQIEQNMFQASFGNDNKQKNQQQKMFHLQKPTSQYLTNTFNQKNIQGRQIRQSVANRQSVAKSPQKNKPLTQLKSNYNASHKLNQKKQDFQQTIQKVLLGLIHGHMNKRISSYQKHKHHKYEEQTKYQNLNSIHKDYLQDYSNSLTLNQILKNFQHFLTYISSAYQVSQLFYIEKSFLKKIKIDNKFYDLHVIKFWGSRYFLKLRDHTGEKQWINFVTQSMLRQVEKISQHKKPQSKVFRQITQNQIQNGNQTSHKYFYGNKDKQKIKAEISQPHIKINIRSQNPFSSFQDILIDQNKQQKCSINKLKMASFQSLNSKILQTEKMSDKGLILAKQNIPRIVSNQNEIFKLTFLRTPFYNKISIQRVGRQLYLSNNGCLSNKYSLRTGYGRIIIKKLIKIDLLTQTEADYLHKKNNISHHKNNSSMYKDNQQDLEMYGIRQRNRSKLSYTYFSVAYCQILNIYKIYIYLSKSQLNYIIFVSGEEIDLSIIVQRSINQQKSKNVNSRNTSKQKQQNKRQQQKQYWQNLVNRKQLILNLKDQQCIINKKQYKVYQIYAKLTLLSSVRRKQATQFDYMCLNPYSQQRLSINNENQQQNSNEADQNRDLLYPSSVLLVSHHENTSVIKFNTQNEQILEHVVEQNPTHLLNNLFSQFVAKQSKHELYNKFFRRLFQRLQKNSLVMEPIEIEVLSKY